MPLYKRKPFSLLPPPQDLDPKDLVFQVRFTKEIFKDYQKYLHRLNFYRERVWTCKATGKSNLTYEEAIVSECRATEKLQRFPEEFVAPVLRMVQYSSRGLLGLVADIHQKLQEHMLEGMELQCKKEDTLCPCRILGVLENGGYEIGWLDKDKKVTDTSVVSSKDLIHKKPPVSRSLLRLFITESTCQSAPWVVHETLAKKHGISTEPPMHIQNGHGEGEFKMTKKRLIEQDPEIIKKAKKGDDKPKAVVIKYPIDDLLVNPASDDPSFTKLPSLSTDFIVPIDLVGDLLMIWNFFSSFSRLLKLWPFSLDDFENALYHKDSGLILTMESHSAILRFLIEDEGDYHLAIQNKRKKLKVTQTNWGEFLCDFLEMQELQELKNHLTTIKRGHYGLLDISIKLSIFCKLITEALSTDAIREKLNECIEKRQELLSAKRGIDRKKKEEMHLKEESDAKEIDKKPENLKGENILQNGEEKHDVSNEISDMQQLKMDNGHQIEEEDNKYGVQSLNKRGKIKDVDIQDKQTDENQKEHLQRQMENLSIRTNSLGKDRNYNRYWFFKRDGRLFVESSDSKKWGYYTSKEELDALIGSLNPKGVRERALKKQLEKNYHRISTALQKRSRDIAHKILLEDSVVRRSTRVRAQPRDSYSMSFLKYVNKWREN